MAVHEPVAAGAVRSKAVAAVATGQPAASVVEAAVAVGSTGWLFASVEPIAVPLPPNQMDLNK